MQKPLDRRNFLKLSATGAAGGLLAGAGTVRAAPADDGDTGKTEGIIHRTLGRTGLQVPVVNLGVMRVDNPRIVTMALDGGMTLLDTAHGYQNGRNETMLGELLENRPRDSFYLATKVNPRRDVLTVDQFIGMFEISLERLKLDYVDILYLHGQSSREGTLHENYLEALTRMRDQGKARFLGVTTHSNEADVIRAAVESGIYDVVCTAYNFRMEQFTELKKAIAEAAGAGLGVIAMKTMAGVYWDRERQDPINTRAALKFALQNENIHTSIPGVTAFHELEDNFEVNKDLTLTEEELRDLRMDTSQGGLFCMGCEECLDQCPHNLPIPDFMRTFMYAYGYRDLSLARSTMDSLALCGDACESCDACQVTCTQGFNVAGKIRDIDRLRHVPSDFLA
ncbi:MAG: twin-arginine translocation signal domain-containing protein [Balneolaceae bacterium]|nr:MAG: twin-arginine translocation signal domain-containing protein [Balneolaceae bacterium]